MIGRASKSPIKALLLMVAEFHLKEAPFCAMIRKRMHEGAMLAMTMIVNLITEYRCERLAIFGKHMDAANKPAR